MPIRLFFLLFLAGICLQSYAQSNNAPSDYDPHDLKITGYFQFQYQKASALGISSFSGGDFADNTDNRFMVRRGRFKFDRVDKFTNIVFQIDATQDGVGLRDGFIQVKDPRFSTFMLTAGQFTKPFGYILSYSSSVREFPERPRFYQTLIPSERDLGAMVSVRPPKYKFISYELGFFNGSGLNARDYDNRKDFSNSLQFNFGGTQKPLSGGFGLSYYKGFVRQKTTTFYSNEIIAGKRGFASKTISEGTYADREYQGINFQLDYRYGLGKTSIKSEYVKGKQPGIAPSASVRATFASRSFSAQPTTDIYNRNFRGFFIWLVQTLPGTSLDLIGNYDIYDPNTFISGSEIGNAGSNTTAADIRYKTFGAGMIYYMNPQVKFTFYYDHPVNEKTSLSGYNSDLSDNIFTVRTQYRF